MEDAMGGKTNQGDEGSDSCDQVKNKRCLRKRSSWVNYGLLDVSSDEEFDKVPFLERTTAKASLRWHPKESCRPLLDEAPVFYPTEKEFEDTLSYIASIRKNVEPYGICRIVPPPSWHPPTLLEEKKTWQTATFATRIQQVNKLQNREPLKKRCRCRRKKKHRWSPAGMAQRHNSSVVSAVGDHISPDTDEKFGFQPGPDFTLESFQKYSDTFKEQHFGIYDAMENLSNEKNEGWKPSVEDIEGEYWRIVEKAAEEIEVLYGADLETGAFGSGFPKSSKLDASESDKYVTSGWNLNNFPRLPGSVLCFEEGDISGVVVPWLYIGMCFSSFCWHVEDHHMYSLNYHHLGEPKLWYGVPGCDAEKLEYAMKKHLPDLFEQQPDLLHELVTQLSPSILKNEGVPVYRTVQKCGEFVLTFPRAYHSGFNCGFNCAEAVNVAPVDWLPHGQTAVELYSKQHRKTSVSHDKLLLGAANRAVKALSDVLLLGNNDLDNLRWKSLCGKEMVLSMALKTRVVMEKKRRDSLLPNMKAQKMGKDFDLACEKECFSCFYDLHFSAISCHCSPDRFACLNHSNLLCSCDSTDKFILVRHDMNELDTLVKALECDVASVLKWASEELHVIPIPTSNLIAHGKTDEGAQVVEISCNRNCQCSTGVDNCSFSSRYRSMEESEVLDVKAPVNYDFLDAFEVGEANSMGNFSLFASDMEKGGEIRATSEQEKVILKSEEIPWQMLSLDLHHKPSSDLIYDFIGLHNIEKSQMLGMSKLAESCHSDKSCKEFDVLARCSDGASCSRDLSDLLKPGRSRLFGIYLDGAQADHKYVNKQKTLDEFDYCIEPLTLGTVVPRKKWCSKEAIFPKGYKSRVHFISVLNPTKMCSYVCEVIDGGFFGPLFKVSVEESPGVAFTHDSASGCWQMILARLNHELSMLNTYGKQKSSLLQPPDKLDGLKLFGFLSPSIAQKIEALDPLHQCADYWEWRSELGFDKVYSSGKTFILHGDMVESYPFDGHCRSNDSFSGNNALMKESSKVEHKKLSLEEVSILRGLFHKASHEELSMMHQVLCSESWSTNLRAVLVTMLEEIQRNVNK